MHSPIESEIVQFLTNDENARSVLQILSRSDDIREACFNQFWSSVLHSLSKERPATIPESVIKLEIRKSNWQFGGVNAFFRDLDRRATQLFYTFEHVIWTQREFAEIYYGLHWVGQIPDSSPIQIIQKVAALREDQKKRGFEFDRNPEFHGWKYFGEGKIRPETFLLQIRGASAEAVISQIVEEFWNFIALTHSEVLGANLEIQNATKPGK